MKEIQRGCQAYCTEESLTLRIAVNKCTEGGNVRFYQKLLRWQRFSFALLSQEDLYLT
ncbi:hypothetical protein Plhal304r1_c006g0024211 [Plasmopara halstedii]